MSHALSSRTRLYQTMMATLTLSTLSFAPFTFATEGGGGVYTNGIENYLASAFPPKGVYYLAYAAHYDADRLMGADGRIPIDFRLKVNALAPRVVWVTDQTVFGGKLGFDVVLPLLDVTLNVNGMRDRKQGIGDMIFGAGLGWNHSARLHTMYIFDTFIPTGDYDKNAVVNLGRNYWAMEHVVGLTYTQASGLNADLKLMLDVNFKNSATNYKSGKELHADYAVGWGFGNGWVAGAGGYLYKQIDDDRQNGVDIGNRGQAFAIGPSIKYENGKGLVIIAKWQKERKVENRPEGSNFMIKTVLPL